MFRSRALYALRDHQTPDPRIAAAMASLLEDVRHPYNVFEALRFVRLRAEAVDDGQKARLDLYRHVYALLGHPDPVLRGTAADVAPFVVPSSQRGVLSRSLERLVDDDHPFVCSQAAGALADLGSQASLRHLIPLLSERDNLNAFQLAYPTGRHYTYLAGSGLPSTRDAALRAIDRLSAALGPDRFQYRLMNGLTGGRGAGAGRQTQFPVVAVILGSSFSSPYLGGLELEPVRIETEHGAAWLHRYPGRRAGWILFRHGLPHRYLPHQIPYRANLLALHTVGCRALLVTSAVGVLDPALPLFEPLLLDDLLMLDNRLADGSACTLHLHPHPGQAHLIVEEGLFSPVLTDQVEGLLRELGCRPPPRVIFGYVPGPRTKTRAENRYWLAAGVHVNSMTVAPEVVLANELEIPTAGLVVGHKYSCPGSGTPLDLEQMRATLETVRQVVEKLVVAFVEQAHAPAFGNRRFSFS